MTSWPLVRRTFATLRKAEFGFLGVRVMTCTQTPRRCGAPLSAGDFVLTTTLRRPLRTNWLIVGIPLVLEVKSSVNPFWVARKRCPPGLQKQKHAIFGGVLSF